MVDIATCNWVDYFNLVDLEGVPLGMLSLVGFNLCLPFEDVANIPFAWCLSLLDVVGLPICT